MKEFDVAIVGGGVSGTALFYTLSKFTDIKKVILLEKHNELGFVNSRSSQNSQTLHFGDIETNYTLEKSTKVKRFTDMLKNYLEESKSKHKGIFTIYPKMVIAIGETEVAELSARYEEFKELFPKLKKIGREEIAKIEPNVIKDRKENELIYALYSEEGYTVDFGLLTKALADDANRDGFEICLNTKIGKIRKEDSHYLITAVTNTGKEEIKASVVIVCAGAHSLLIAHSLDYGKEFGILSIAGSFYNSSEKLLNGKVYTMQKKKLPFAAVHGDPEVHDENITRFGPTAKPIFMLERYNYSTVGEYFKTLGIGWKQITTLCKLTFDPIIFKYLLRNFFYDWPFIGKRLFLKEARKVVPSITAGQITYAKNYGGNRPQTVNIEKKTLDTGEAKIVGENIIFNITPSPGASTCLGNAYRDAEMIADFLTKSGKKTEFHKTAFEKLFVR